MLRLQDGMAYYGRAFPNVLFANDGASRLTWSEANECALRIAGALARDGISSGGRFAYLSKNSVEMACTYFGAAYAGAVPVPLNYRLAPVEWSQIINDANCSLVIASAEYAPQLDEVRKQCPNVKHWVVDAKSAPNAGWIAREAWTAGVSFRAPAATVTPSNVLYQMYTSGSTGLPKGVLLSHANVLTCAQQVLMAQDYRPSPGDLGLIVGPMYHASGAFPLVVAALTGMSLRIETQFDPAQVAKALAGGVAWALLVPIMIQAVLQSVAKDPPGSFEKLRMIFYGAAPMPEALLGEAFRVFGCQMGQGFGQTEAAACITFLTHEDHVNALKGKPHLLGSVGRPLAGTDVVIMDDNGTILPPGQPGEIVIRGPQVMQGYWNAKEKTDEAIRDGWLHTGDAGMLDEAGYLYIQDRLKDMIVTGGSNVFSIEVERALQEHPAVAEIAVIGIPDEKWGEAVMAIVVPKAGSSVSLDELREFGRTRLGSYKLPKSIEIASALPRNASGKLLKHVLREPYWAGRSKSVA